MRCEKAESLLIAAADGELTARERRALDRHLSGCRRCRAEQTSTEGVLAALGRLAGEAAVPVALEQRVLRAVRAAAADEAELGSMRRAWDRLRSFAPPLAATVVVVVAVLGLRSGEPPLARPEIGVGERDVAVATRPTAPAAKPVSVARRREVRVPDEPPAELAAQAELFVDLPLVRDIEKVRNFDAIAGMDGGDGRSDGGAEGRSNG